MDLVREAPHPSSSGEHLLLPTTAAQLDEIQGFFGLSKSQLAKACRVQRQTIYDWYARRFEAEGRNAQRLHSFVTEASGGGVLPPVREGCASKAK
jgi:hypothetical protein